MALRWVVGDRRFQWIQEPSPSMTVWFRGTTPVGSLICCKCTKGEMKGIVFNDSDFSPDLISSEEIRLDNANEVFTRHSL